MIIEIHKGEAHLRPACAVVLVDLLGPIDEAAAVDAYNCRQRRLGALRKIDIHLVIGIIGSIASPEFWIRARASEIVDIPLCIYTLRPL
jgi:hypothetical protein